MIATTVPVLTLSKPMDQGVLNKKKKDIENSNAKGFDISH